MRQWGVVAGFFIIILIMVAGCTSTQNTSTGSKSQTPVSDDSTPKMTSTNSLTSIINCDRPPLDPVPFQKFFPDVPGYERKYGKKTSDGYSYVDFIEKHNSTLTTNLGTTNFGEVYTRLEKSKFYDVGVSFEDLGPCVESEGGAVGLNANYISMGDKVTTQNKINNFHGYPALHVIRKINSSSESIRFDRYDIGMNDRLFVHIHLEDFSGNGCSLSEAEYEIEKFANAIDFRYFAASV